MSQKLAGKKAVVTGGNSGIGRATATELIAQGADVLITGRQPDLVDQAAREIGAFGLVSDQSDLADIDALAQEIATRFGQVDILFINAGVLDLAPLETITETQFDRSMNINFKGAFFTLQKLLPKLNDKASVVFLSSINAHAAMANSAVYAASKAAMNALMKVAAVELAPRGIRVNAVSPGPINTPLFGKVGFSDEQLAGFATAVQNHIPLRKFGTPEEVAKMVAFLASDDASFSTGAEYMVDGGINLNQIIG